MCLFEDLVGIYTFRVFTGNKYEQNIVVKVVMSKS